MELREAVEQAIEAMKKAVNEGKYTVEEGDKFIKNVNDLLQVKEG
jgi:hypothetical protein